MSKKRSHKVVNFTTNAVSTRRSPSDYLSLREEHSSQQTEIDLPYDSILLPGRVPPQGLALFSFFAGAGFLDLGFEMAGFHPAFVNEFNPEFLKAHRYSRTEMEIPLASYGDSAASVEVFLKGSAAKTLEDLVRAARQNALVGFVGGPPCPDFSVGGKNRGRDGENGRLTASYFELIAKHQPDWFLFENVKGLWSTKRHRAFYEENIQKILKAGYAVTDQLINAIEYGAPQDRARIICIGFSRSISGKLGFKAGEKIPSDLFPWSKYKTYKAGEIFAKDWPTIQPFGQKVETLKKDIPSELTVQHWFDRNEVKKHPNAECRFNARAGLARFETVDEGDVSRKSYKRLHRMRYSPTACYGNNEVHLHPNEPRRISVAEALAIQSLPKEFVLPPNMTLSAMFKTVGNGVPFLAANRLAVMIREVLEKNL